MRPHCSQSSRENAITSSGTSPLTPWKEVPPEANTTFWKNLYLPSVTIKTKSLKYFFSWSIALGRNLFSYKTDLMLFND